MSLDLNVLRQRLRKTRRIPEARKIIPIIVFFLSFISIYLITILSYSSTQSIQLNTYSQTQVPVYTLNCSNGNTTAIFKSSYPSSSSPGTCPEYFRWIHEDLRPWKETGITREMVERAKKTAHFRVVIVDGKVYMEKYKKSIQTRDIFTLWGILQLMRWYPGRVPDLELMFDCDDRPVVPARDFLLSDSSGPPPVFRYCSDQSSLDIVFPDWSFWGWAEINIKPWGDVLEDIKQGNSRTKWRDRVPYAYWKGNPHVAPSRRDLLKCNVSEKADWNTRLYIQDWIEEGKVGFKQSNLEDQCTHRYKIYIEGWAWSVSEKYILACDSMALLVQPRFYDFLTRGMMPLKHYWPIRNDHKCKSLRFAVDWGNNHTTEAENIGSMGSHYIHDNVRIEFVYDYMFHLLSQYSKLLRFKPTISSGIVELRPEMMVCVAEDMGKKFMMDSFVASPVDGIPCSLPPYNATKLEWIMEMKRNLTRQVYMWEDNYWRQHERTN